MITNTGEDDVIAFGLCEKNYPANKLPGWYPLSAGFHGDDGGIFVDSTKMTYSTNETFKEAKIGVYLEANYVRFSKGPTLGLDDYKISCYVRMDERILTEDLPLYPCVGFRFAKDVIVRTSGYEAKRSFNDRFEDDQEKPTLCPWVFQPRL